MQATGLQTTSCVGTLTRVGKTDCLLWAEQKGVMIASTYRARAHIRADSPSIKTALFVQNTLWKQKITLLIVSRKPFDGDGDLGESVEHHMYLLGPRCLAKMLGKTLDKMFGKMLGEMFRTCLHDDDNQIKLQLEMLKNKT